MTPSRWARVKSLFFRTPATANGNEPPSLLEEVRQLQAFAKSSSLAVETADGPSQEEPLTPQQTSFENGAIVAERFEVIRCLGRGGMGEVYEAHNVVNRTKVAIKVLRPDMELTSQSSERLLRREFLISQKISHPNVCRVNDLYVHSVGNQIRYVVSMELLPGQTLAEIFASQGVFPPATLAEIARQILAGIEAAHSQGIVHRDLKPGNIMLVKSESGTRVVVTDFGLARSDRDAVSSLTNLRGFAGTLRYMAPEQIKGEPADTRSDLYSTALVLYELLTAGFPFPGSTGMALALNRLSIPPRDPAQLLPAIPLNWRVALLRALAPKPENRFQTAGQFSAALDAEPASARLKAYWALRQVKTQNKPLVTVISLVAILATFTFFFKQQSVPPKPFTNLLFTGISHPATVDPVISGTELTLLQSLRQSPRLRIATAQETAATFARMGKTDLSKLRSKDFREAALRTGRHEVLLGAVSKDTQYHLRLELQGVAANPNYYSQTNTQTFDAADGEDMFRAIAAASDWVRKQSGESAHDLFEQNVRPADLTTGSWQALHLLEEARLRRDVNDPNAALTFLDEALQLDNGFAAAEALRADILSQLRQHRESITAYRQAITLAKQRNITGRERFEIEAAFSADIFDYPVLQRTLNEWLAHFPVDYRPHFLLSGLYYDTADYPKALAAIQDAQKLEPDYFVTYPHMAAIDLTLGRSSDATRCAQKLRALNEPEWATFVDALIFTQQARFSEAAQILRPLLSQGGEWNRLTSSWLANILASAGNFAEAESVLRRTLIPTATDQEKAQQILAIAYLHWLQKDIATIGPLLNPILPALDNPRDIAEAGALLARTGDLAGAHRALALLDRWPSVAFQIEARQRLTAEIWSPRLLPPNFAAAAPTPVVLDFMLHAVSCSQARPIRSQINQIPSWLIFKSQSERILGLYWLAAHQPCPPN